MFNDEEIRRIVREEVNRQQVTPTPVNTTPTNIYARTQAMIRQSVQSNASTAMSVSPLQATPTQSASLRPKALSASFQDTGASQTRPTLSSQRKSNTGHPWRLQPYKGSGKAKKTKNYIEKMVYVWLLRYPLEDVNDEGYGYNEDMILSKGYVCLTSYDDEINIRQKIVELFLGKFRSIKLGDIEFLKRERQTLCVPFVPPDWHWGFENVKALMGQGKLYCRLSNVSSRRLIDTLTNQNSVLTSSDKENVTPDNQQSNQSEDRQFQDHQDHNYAASGTSELQALVNEVLDNQEKSKCQKSEFANLNDVFTHFETEISEEKQRLRTEQDNELEDIFILLKDVNFDEKKKLVVRYNKQAAVDTGGVARQFFSQAFHQLYEGDSFASEMFIGAENRKLPTHDSAVILSGMFELVGKLMAYSIAQCGIGIGFLAPCVYSYISTGEVASCTEVMSIDDCINNVTLKHYFDKISNATNDAILESIFTEEEFLNLYAESGTKLKLSMANREAVMQAIIFNEAIGKRIAAMEQIRKGLNLFGVRQMIEAQPSIFLPLMCYDDKLMTPDLVLKKMEFDEESKAENMSTHEYFVQFVQSSDIAKLKKICLYCTGVPSIFLGKKNIKVFYRGDRGFYSSICFQTLDIPAVNFESQEEFDAAFLAALEKMKTKVFTVV